MREPTTEAGRRLAAALEYVPHDEYPPVGDMFADDIAAIEAEAVEQERARIAARVGALPLAGLTEAHGPLGSAQAVRAAVLAIVDEETA